MKCDKTKAIVNACFELMESEEREQGFARHEYLAEILIYTDAAKLDADSRQLYAAMDVVLDRECISVYDEDCGWRYYGKMRATVENINEAAKSRVDHSRAILMGAIENGTNQIQIAKLVSQGETYHAAESMVRRLSE